jgi:glycosyltransferase involved in cell wall biosynthesis
VRIVAAHNYYLQPGGEDEVFLSEAHLLENRGHTVFRHSVGNHRVLEMSRAAVAAAALWSRRAGRGIGSLIERERPAVVHFHNTFPLLSPSCYEAAKKRNARVVQTLHNYRLLCPNARLERGGRPCESCLGRALAWPGILHGCYRGSRAATAALATATALHRAAGTWANAVDVYIALTGFARARFVAGGLPPGKIAVKPNFVWPDPGAGPGTGGYALFAGRLSAEKGLETAGGAWNRLGPGVPLKIAGQGPLEAVLGGIAGVELLGRRPRPEVLGLMRQAAFLIFPSLWYEGLPMTILEAFACGLPVIASRLGAMAEVIEDGRTGLLFNPGDAGDLAAKVEWAGEHPVALARMRREARAEFEAKYTAARNYEMLMEIYGRAGAGKN